jgi:hypothetical protein
MKIVLLAPPNVEEYYTASLLVRGFKAVTIPAGVPVLDFPKLMQEYLKHDGCLLISDDPNLVEIADQFVLIGKPVWRYLAEIPRLLVEMPFDRLVPRRKRRPGATPQGRKVEQLRPLRQTHLLGVSRRRGFNMLLK